MIPLSNGKSPRVDQFYATLRSLKTSPWQSPAKLRTEEDRSIDHIRSLGKQILADRSAPLKKTLPNTTPQKPKIETPAKPENLYDKYKQRLEKKAEKLVECRRDQIVRETTNSKEKAAKNPKYENIGPKITQPTGVKVLNYVKRSDQKAEELRQVKKAKETVKVEIKNKQKYYDTKVRDRNDQLLGGLLQRSVEMGMRKSLSIEKTRDLQLAREMEGVTFKPEKVSKDVLKNPKRFQERLVTNELKKMERQKDLLRQTISFNKFKPYLNPQRERRAEEWMGKNEWIKNEEEEPTMHSVTQITLRSLDEMSFMLE